MYIFNELSNEFINKSLKKIKRFGKLTDHFEYAEHTQAHK